MPLVSVIIPVYNAKKHLDRCLESVLYQTFIDFEVIIVDDGSTDNSFAICKQYEQKDKRLHVFKKKNGGANSARSLGLNYSKGEYINFVDADDYIPPTSLEDLYSRAIQYNLDIVQAATIFRSSDGNEKPSLLIKEGILKTNDFIRGLFLAECDGGPHGNLYKRNLFDKNTFNLPNEVKLGEDFYMNLCLGLNAKRIGLFNDVKCYYYAENDKSVTHTFQFENLNSQKYQLESIRRILIEKDSFDIFAPLYYIRALNALASACFHNKKLIYDEYIKKINKESANYSYAFGYKTNLLRLMFNKPKLYFFVNGINDLRKILGC